MDTGGVRLLLVRPLSTGCLNSPQLAAFSAGVPTRGGGGGGGITVSITSRRKPDTSFKRTRPNAGYELSSDLAERQVACLERRYGGRRARLAATTIQRAYRRHALSKKFQAITLSAKSERRLSRRFHAGSGWDPVTSSSTAVTSRASAVSLGAPPAPPLLDVSVENDSDASDREYQSYSCLSDSAYVSQLCTPRRGGGSTPTEARLQEGVYLRTSGSSPVEARLREGGLLRPGDSSLADSSRLVQSKKSALGAAYQGGDARCPARRPVAEGRGDAPALLSSTTSSLTRRLEAASSGSETSLSSNGGPVRTSSPLLLRRSQRSASRSSGGGAASSIARAQSDSTVLGVQRLDRAAADRLDRLERTTAGGMCRSSSESSRQFQNGHPRQPASLKVPEIVRKRQYRVGLNLFNTKPDRGVEYLVGRGFLDAAPESVARFLITRKGLSKQMIGEYLGDLQSPFSAAVLEAFAQELDFYNMQVDVALRKFQTHFRLPGEAQKIERLMEVFGQRYCQCNHEFVSTLKTADTVFVLAFAIIMLNTDLFTPNIKPEHKMKPDEFIKNLRGIDDGADVDPRLLAGIYERVRAQQFRPGPDHVTAVHRVQQATTGKRPPLALPHRRLVCYCRLYEVPDVSKKERPGLHQREVFLFNDLMLVTKVFSKKKSSVTYACRQSLQLAGLSVSAFDLPYYPFGIRLSQRVDGKVLLTFNARNEHDRAKFCEDLRESILEMDEMEALRIDAGLERQKPGVRVSIRSAENRDSGVADVEADGSDGADGSSAPGGPQLRRAALSNSLLDVSVAGGGARLQRRGSVGSLDSGMSVSFQSGSTASAQTGSPPTQPAAGTRVQRRH